MKTALTLAGLVLAATGLVGCGDDGGGGSDDAGGMPTDASTEEFCGNFQAFAEDLGELSLDSDPTEVIAQMQEASGDLRSTGVPESASEDEREGLEVTLDAIDSLDEDATLDDIGNLEEDFSAEEQEKADAFGDYLDDECGDL